MDKLYAIVLTSARYKVFIFCERNFIYFKLKHQQDI